MAFMCGWLFCECCSLDGKEAVRYIASHTLSFIRNGNRRDIQMGSSKGRMREKELRSRRKRRKERLKERVREAKLAPRQK